MITGKRLDNGLPLHVAVEPGNHVQVAGITGSGKSNLVNYYLWQLAELDYASLVLCNAAGKPDYIQWLPRASCIAVGKEATDQALDEVLDLVWSRYADLIPVIPNDLTDERAIEIAGKIDRQVTISTTTPLIFVVVDEFVEYLKGKGGAERLRKLHSVLTIGRAAGLQCALATQRPSDEQANTDIREQIAMRVLFASDAAGSVMVFGPAGKGLPVDKIVTKGQGFALDQTQRTPTPFIAPECTEADVRLKAAATARLRPITPFTRYIDDNRKVA